MDGGSWRGEEQLDPKRLKLWEDHKTLARGAAQRATRWRTIEVMYSIA